jgi:hypothetical protein
MMLGAKDNMKIPGSLALKLCLCLVAAASAAACADAGGVAQRSQFCIQPSGNRSLYR